MRPLGVALALASLGACAIPPDLARARRGALAAPAVENAPLVELVGAIHVHSPLSHDAGGTFEELVEGARRAGLDFVALTDHPSRRRRRGLDGEREGVLFIPGAEISAKEGSILALGLREPIATRRASREERIRQVEAKGAVPFLGHVEELRSEEIPEVFRGMGLVNLHAAVRENVRSWRAVPFFLAGMASFALNPPELRFLFLVQRDEATLEVFDRVLARRPFAAIAESDAHARVRLGPLRLDSYEAVFSFLRNHVLVRERSEAEILAALAEGRSFLAFDALADARGFRFVGSGGGETVVGAGSIAAGTETLLEVWAPALGRVRVIHDGRVHVEADECQLVRIRDPALGVWRVEVDLPVRGRWRPWIYSNAIRVVPPPASPPGP
jgi:hypothetical protein